MGSIIIREFHDALNAVSQPITKRVGFADAMSNVLVSTRNTVQKKPGFAPINSVAYESGSEILSLFDFQLQQGNIVRKTIFQAGTKLYDVHHQSGVAGVIKSGLAQHEFQYEVSGSTVYMGNQVNMLKYYAIAGYALFSDFAWNITDIYDQGRSSLGQGFKSLHKKQRNVASVSIAIQRVGTISSARKVTVEIQTDNAGAPSGTAIPNGISNQIDGSDITSNWLWTSFTFGAILPILQPATKYWIVLEVSGNLVSPAVINWGTDTTTPAFDPDCFFSVNDSGWVPQVGTVGLFQVFVEPDQWGIDAPTNAPSVSGSATNNPRYDDPSTQDADEELIGLPDLSAELSQSWQFTGTDDRTVTGVQLYLKKTGLPLGALQVVIRPDVDGRPGDVALGSFPALSMASLTTSYQFITFTFNEFDELTLRANTKYWLHLSGSFSYLTEFVTGVTSVSWGADASSPSFLTGEFARAPGVRPWVVDNSVDALFRITSSLQNAGGRKYAYSFKNSVTGHVSNRSPESVRSGNFDVFTVGGFDIPTDPQVDEIIIWATTDGGAIFFKLDEQTVNTSTTTPPLIGSQSTDREVVITVGNSPDTYGAWVELITNLTVKSTWVTLSIAPATGNIDPTAEIDIGIGSSGFETVLIDKIVFEQRFNFNVDGGSSHMMSFPIEIPAGTRISARGRDSVTGLTTYNVALTAYNPDLAFGGGGAAQITDGPVTEDDLDFTQEAPLCNFIAPLGDIISRARDSIIVAGVRSNLHRAFYSAGLGQTLVGVPEESFPAFNFVQVPSGSERIFNVDSIDGAPVMFTTDQIFTIAGETPESFRAQEMRGGKGIGSVAKLGSAATEVGLFFMSTDRKIYLLPTVSHIPELMSEVIEDELEQITSDSSLMVIRSMEKVRMEYLHFGDRHWLATAIPTGATSNLNNELWIYDIDLHNIHAGRGWMGPLVNTGAEGFQTLRVITEATHDKNLFFGDDGGFIHQIGIGNQDNAANFASSVTFPFMDDQKPDIVKDGLTVEVIVPASQTVPANFLEVSYDSETNFEVIPLVQVNEMERGASAHKYRGYLMRQFVRIKPRVNFATENASGELWSLRIDYNDLYDNRGFIHDANA